MNLNRSVLLVLVILICCSTPGVLSNFTVLKNLLGAFKSSSSPTKSSPTESSPTESSPAESLPVESLPVNGTSQIPPAESPPTASVLTNETVKPAEPIDQQSISAERLESTNQRSTLISEDDHKFSPASVFKDGLFRGNFISHLQDLIKRRSVEASEQSAIVNDEDIDEEKESEDEPNQEDGLVVVSSSKHDEVSSSKHDEAASEEDGEEEDDDEDEDDFNFHKKSTADEPEVDGNDLKLPPRRKLIEQILDQLDKEIKSLAAIVKQSKDEVRELGIEYNKTTQLNHKAEQEMKQVMALRDAANGTQIVQLNQNIKLNETVQSTKTVPSNKTVQTVQTVPLNETDLQPSIKSFSKFDNSTNATSYTYLGEQAENSDLLPAMVQPKLLGNTLESLEKILNKYTFLNLYPAPTINDTHNDRDLHQKQDDRVVLKANFADYPGYANTDKALVLGQAPPVQNLTNISYGNVRVGNSSRVESGVESDDKIEIIKN